MRSRWIIAAAPFLALAGACSDGIGPSRDIVGALTLDFCAGEAPVFFAYQNEGGDWTRVTGDGSNTFSFDVTERVAVAMTFNFGNETLTDIYYATRTELLPLSDRACVETSGGKTVNGTVSDVLAGEAAVVSMSEIEEVVEPPPSTFSLQGVAEGPQDIVAHREVNTLAGLVPDRVIVRRAQNPTNGATIAALDFSTTTSDAVTASTVTMAGLQPGETNLLDIYFQTALGTTHTLYLAPEFANATQAIYGVPSTLTQAGDLHRLDLQAEAAVNDYRAVRHWYRNPANQSVALGAPLNNPSITFVGASPYLRMRASVASQFDYGSFATAYFIQGTTIRRSVFVTQTSGYAGGTPSTWTMEIPDVTEAGGYPGTAGLVSGQGTQWFVEAFNGSLSDFIGANPTEGATVRWAGLSSSVTLLRADGGAPERGSRRRSALNQRAFRR
jgi:hypothetical protein